MFVAGFRTDFELKLAESIQLHSLGSCEHRNRYNLNEVKTCKIVCERRSVSSTAEHTVKNDHEDTEGDREEDNEGDEDVVTEEDEDSDDPEDDSVTELLISEDGTQTWTSISDFLATCPWESSEEPACNNCNEQRTSVLCVAEIVPATVRCIDCDEYFCRACFNAIHSGGKRKLHQVDDFAVNKKKAEHLEHDNDEDQVLDLVLPVEGDKEKNVDGDACKIESTQELINPT